MQLDGQFCVTEGYDAAVEPAHHSFLALEAFAEPQPNPDPKTPDHLWDFRTGFIIRDDADDLVEQGQCCVNLVRRRPGLFGILSVTQITNSLLKVRFLAFDFGKLCPKCRVDALVPLPPHAVLNYGNQLFEFGHSCFETCDGSLLVIIDPGFGFQLCVLPEQVLQLLAIRWTTGQLLKSAEHKA